MEPADSEERDDNVSRWPQSRDSRWRDDSGAVDLDDELQEERQPDVARDETDDQIEEDSEHVTVATAGRRRRLPVGGHAEPGDDETVALLLPPSPSPGAPTDKYNLVYCVFYLLGMGTLLPWNFFISVNSFWEYKFRNVNASFSATNQSDEHSRSPKSEEEEKTELQKEFTSYLAIASNVPNALCVILNALFGQNFKLKYRLLLSLAFIIIFFFIIMLLARTNSDKWQREFLEFVLVVVVVINCWTAVFQGGVFGVAGKFPAAYIGAVMAGQAMGGIFPSLVDIFVIALRVKDQDTGFYCFFIATVVLLACFLSFSWVRRVAFFKYYARRGPTLAPDSSSSEGDLGTNASGQQEEQSSVYGVIHRYWQYCLAVYLIFGVTLSVFPAVTVLVQSEIIDDGHHTLWTDRYFTPVTCFLLFNVGDYAGRTMATTLQWPHGDGRGHNFGLIILALLRGVFIPAFMLCNASPTKRSLPVVFGSDSVYIAFMLVFAVSNGYLGNLCMLLGPKSFSSSHDQELAAMLLVAFLVAGTGSGAFLSYPIVSAI